MSLFESNFSPPQEQGSRRIRVRIQGATNRQLEHLLSDPEHPSLNIKKMKDPREIWEDRVTESYRFTFQIQEDIYNFQRIYNVRAQSE